MPPAEPPRAHLLPARNAASSPGLESRLGEKLSILFRIAGDPDHPFSEAVGLLQRVAANAAGVRVLHVCRRDGSVVEVAEDDIVRLKFIPIRPGGPFRIPKSWEGGAPGSTD